MSIAATCSAVSSGSITRRTLGWRARATFVVRENENAVDMLNASCLMLTRLVSTADSDTRRRLERPMRDLADVIASLAGALFRWAKPW
ncbi:hypothetical protein [Actinomadura livida]|nr:hypothetical protein [Actinomadura livida]GGU10644.1 hypothetical protein GCM10010208_39180 [Actinomadura livida]